MEHLCRCSAGIPAPVSIFDAASARGGGTFDCDRAAGRCVLDRVVQYVDQQLPEPIGVTLDNQAGEFPPAFKAAPFSTAAICISSATSLKRSSSSRITLSFAVIGP